MITRNIWDSQSQRKMIMKRRFERNWGPGMFPSDEEISHAKWLEAGGILDPGLIQSLRERIKKALKLGGRRGDPGRGGSGRVKRPGSVLADEAFEGYSGQIQRKAEDLGQEQELERS